MSFIWTLRLRVSAMFILGDPPARLRGVLVFAHTDGVHARSASGRPTKLGLSARRRLRELLLHGAHKSGFSTDLCTFSRVGRIIKREFGVHYHVNHLGHLLHGLGFSPQEPEAQAPADRRDELKMLLANSRQSSHQWKAARCIAAPTPAGLAQY